MLKLPYKVTQVEDDAITLQLQPGLMSIVSDRDAKGRWKDGNLVRFTPSSGLPAKMGGWSQIIPTNLTGGNFTGAGRTLHEWQSLDRQLWAAIGTNCKLYIYNQGSAYDITPSRRFATLTNPFSTQNGSPTVIVTDANHGANPGDHIQFSGFSAVGGLTISGEYNVVSTTLNTYTITASSNATSTVTGGGSGSVNYDISCMSVGAAPQFGWGAGSWGTARLAANLTGSISGTTLTVTAIANGVIGSNGTNTLGGTGVTSCTVTAQLSGPTGGIGTYTVSVSQNVGSEAMTLTQGWSEPSSSSNIFSDVGFWSLGNWGEDLIASPRGGGIYVWKRSGGPFSKATLIPGAPSFNNLVIVAQDARQLIAFGSSNIDSTGTILNGTLDPSLIRWSSSEDYTSWIAATTNTAGSIRLTSGSGIVTAGATRGGYFVNTTTSAHLMYATGDTNVYTTTPLGKTTRPCSPLAQADYNGVTYIMCQDNFMIYDGVLRVLPCELWNRVFGPVSQQQTYPPINQQQFAKVICHINREFSEVWWHYPSGANTENDSYVVYNWLLNCWHAGVWSGNLGGDINRSAGHDFGDIFKAPYMMYYNTATQTSQLFQHETGLLANGQGVFGEFIESYDTDIEDSGGIVHISHLLPSMKDFTGQLTIAPPPLPNINMQRADLLHFDDGANTFVDSGQTPLTWTASAGGADAAPVESSAQAKFGTGSLFCGGAGVSAGTYISTPANTGMDLNNADFTIEMWTYVTALPGSKTLGLFDCSDIANSSGFAIVINQNGQIGFMGYGNGANGPSGTASTFSGIVVSTGVWKHLFVQRKGDIITIGYDGTVQLKIQCQVSGILTTTTGPLRVGGVSANMSNNNASIAGGGAPLRGYIDEFSLVYGAGSYGATGAAGASYTVPTAAFTTPFVLPPYTVQTMLHFEDGQGSTAFTDNAFTPLTWTAAGGAIESNAQAKFGVGSLSSTGTGSMITTPNNASGPFDETLTTSDWTLDFWLYVPTLPGAGTTTILDFSSGASMFTITLNSAGLLTIVPVGWTFPLGNPTFGTITAGAWHHVALAVSYGEVQSGTTLFSLWRPYLDGVGANTQYRQNAMPSLPGSGGLAKVGQSAGTSLAQCFIDEFRFVNGINVWTAASFTPPTGPTGNTSSLYLSSLPVTLKVRKYPADAYKIKGPYTLYSTTQKLSARAKGRQIAIRIGPLAPVPLAAGASWAMGAWRLKIGQDGDR